LGEEMEVIVGSRLDEQHFYHVLHDPTRFAVAPDV
jgi:predicted methyltransferase